MKGHKKNGEKKFEIERFNLCFFSLNLQMLPNGWG